MEAHVIMNLAETRKRRRLYVLLTLMFILVGLVGTIVGFLKLLHGMGIAQGPIAKLFHAIWWVPGIPWLWEHASLISPGMPGNWSLYSYVCIGLVFIGVVFRLLAGSKHYDITQSNREARVERLKRERLGDTHPPGSRITTVTGGTFHGSFIGDVTGGHAQINYTFTNDLEGLSALVTKTLTSLREFPLTPSQRVQFKTELETIRQECTVHTPNHIVLRRALGQVGYTVRHLAEAGTAHVLVAHWQEILQTLHLSR